MSMSKQNNKSMYRSKRNNRITSMSNSIILNNNNTTTTTTITSTTTHICSLQRRHYHLRSLVRDSRKEYFVWKPRENKGRYCIRERSKNNGKQPTTIISELESTSEISSLSGESSLSKANKSKGKDYPKALRCCPICCQKYSCPSFVSFDSIFFFPKNFSSFY
eukprot:Anaeramoba_ignava/a349797_175.p1 GENE.a349797_175~~a349797_175.p1  ORF type:complete len:163 (-),score=33.15 a349797_175:616-1104(-)